MFGWIKRLLAAGELERMAQGYDDLLGKHHDRYQGLLDQHITLKGELAEVKRERDELVASLSQQNIEHGRIEACREMQDETLQEVLSFLEALDFNKTRGAAALRSQRDALLERVKGKK